MAPSIINTFLNSWMFIPTLIITTAVISIVFFKEFVDPKEEDIEEQALEETVKGDVSDIVELFGSSVKKKISYGITPIGMVEKAFSYKEKVQVDDDDEESEIENEFYYFKIRPTGFLARVMAWLLDDILNFETGTKYIIVEKDYIHDGELLTIDDRWNPEKLGGVWLPAFDQAGDFIKERAYKEMFESTLETGKESIRMVNHMNLKFAQSIQELEKEEELLQKRFGGKAAGMVNEE